MTAAFVNSGDSLLIKSHTLPASAEKVREATLCMIRRNDGYNVPAMSRYLASRFPEIPSDWRMPIVVAAFTAVQKASAVHGDTLLRGDDDRTEWARRSLARWTHGLSAVEPGKFIDNHEGSSSCEFSTAGSTPNLLESRQLPVPSDSSFAMADVAAILKENEVVTVISSSTSNDASDVLPDGIIVESGVVDIDAIMNSWGKIGDDDEAHPQIVPSIVPSVSNSSKSEQLAGVSGEAETAEVVAPDHGDSGQKSDENFLSMPLTFDDLLTVESSDLSLNEQTTQPLEALLTPLASPKASQDIGCRDEPTPMILASPHPSLDEDLISVPVVPDNPITEPRSPAKSSNHAKSAPHVSKKRKTSSTKTKENVGQTGEKGGRDSAGVIIRSSVIKVRDTSEFRTPFRVPLMSANGRSGQIHKAGDTARLEDGKENKDEVNLRDQKKVADSAAALQSSEVRDVSEFRIPLRDDKAKKRSDDYRSKRHHHDRSHSHHAEKRVMVSPPRAERWDWSRSYDRRQFQCLPPPPPPPQYFNRYIDAGPPGPMPRWGWR